MLHVQGCGGKTGSDYSELRQVCIPVKLWEGMNTVRTENTQINRACSRYMTGANTPQNGTYLLETDIGHDDDHRTEKGQRGPCLRQLDDCSLLAVRNACHCRRCRLVPMPPVYVDSTSLARSQWD